MRAHGKAGAGEGLASPPWSRCPCLSFNAVLPEDSALEILGAGPGPVFLNSIPHPAPAILYVTPHPSGFPRLHDSWLLAGLPNGRRLSELEAWWLAGVKSRESNTLSLCSTASLPGTSPLWFWLRLDNLVSLRQQQPFPLPLQPRGGGNHGDGG